MRVSLETLTETTLILLEKAGYPPDEASIILEVLLYAQLRGNNQGVVKLIGTGLPRDPHRRPAQIIRETPISALIDGGRSVGMVVMRRALDVAINKARENGIALVGTNNTNTSTGAIGFYAYQAAQSGLLAFVFAGSGEYVAMYGSYQPMLGTNPLAVGIPTGGKPVVFDMSTSAIARYGLIEAKAAGRPISSNIAYDRRGEPTTDPAAALAGAIRTFGGYKGAGLSFIIEILTGVLVGTQMTSDGHKADWGNLIMVINPNLLTDLETFEARTQALIDRVKAASRLPGFDEILIPGERGNKILDEVLQSGEVEIDEALWLELIQTAERG